MNKELIKQTLQTAGWAEIEQIFKDEILEGRKAINFNTNGKDYKTVAVECMAREKAAKTLDRILKRIKSYGISTETIKDSYK